MGNSKFESGLPVCEHGSLYRSCEICERDKEISELRAENERLRGDLDVEKELSASLRQSVSEYRADSERYRWLRKGLRLEYLADQIEDGAIEDASSLDAAIDALRGEGE